MAFVENRRFQWEVRGKIIEINGFIRFITDLKSMKSLTDIRTMDLWKVPSGKRTSLWKITTFDG
jgi:hypothetical protein